MNQNKQPEALRFSVESEMSRAFEIEYGQSWTDPEWRREAGIWASAWHKATNAELRRLHTESELHLQELRSYRITVENREARILELEASKARVPLNAFQRRAIFDDLYPHGATSQTWQVFSTIVTAVERFYITQEKQG